MNKVLAGLIVVFVVLHVASSTIAVPFLQLDANPRAGYVDETIIAAGNTFTVRALINPKDPNYSAVQTYYLSAAIVPSTMNPNFGSFAMDGNIADGDKANGGYPMQYGTPPVDPKYPALPPHDIFPTWYAEFSFKLPSTTMDAYNTETLTSEPGSLFYQDFEIDISGLMDNVELHFDLYTFSGTINAKSKQGIKIWKAPLSHDVESGGKVPDGGTTITLLGAALIGLGVFRRRIA